MTAAHRSYPFGTKLRLTYGKRSVIVRINDRGPWGKSYASGVRLDVTQGVAQKLGFINKGKVRLKVEVL